MNELNKNCKHRKQYYIRDMLLNEKCDEYNVCRGCGQKLPPSVELVESEEGNEYEA